MVELGNGSNLVWVETEIFLLNVQKVGLFGLKHDLILQQLSESMNKNIMIDPFEIIKKR